MVIGRQSDAYEKKLEKNATEPAPPEKDENSCEKKFARGRGAGTGPRLGGPEGDWKCAEESSTKGKRRLSGGHSSEKAWAEEGQGKEKGGEAKPKQKVGLRCSEERVDGGGGNWFAMECRKTCLPLCRVLPMGPLLGGID